jgi:hypothetical protein
MKQGFVILAAEVGADAHVQCDRAGDARRETLRRIMTAGAVLIEHLLAAIGATRRGPLRRTSLGRTVLLRTLLLRALLRIRAGEREQRESRDSRNKKCQSKKPLHHKFLYASG